MIRSHWLETIRKAYWPSLWIHSSRRSGAIRTQARSTLELLEPRLLMSGQALTPTLLKDTDLTVATELSSDPDSFATLNALEATGTKRERSW